MIGFGNGKAIERMLDGQPVSQINADLTSAVDLTAAKPLSENAELCFIGTQRTGPFDISHEQALELLAWEETQQAVLIVTW